MSGGWLRPTVSGAVDGLVTSASLIASVGGGVPARTVALTGVAALSAITTRLDVSIEGRWVRPGSRKGFQGWGPDRPQILAVCGGIEAGGWPDLPAQPR